MGVLPPFTRTTGVAQGDNLSLVLFSVLLSDLPETIQEAHDLVTVIPYADDACLKSRSRLQLQKAMKTLRSYSEENDLEINVSKTKMMKFGRGDLPAAGVIFTLADAQIEKVNHFTYLGLEISGTNFSRHISNRIGRVRLAFASISKPHELALDTALALFDMKVLPTVSYGVEIYWEHMTEEQLERIDKLFFEWLLTKG